MFFRQNISAIQEPANLKFSKILLFEHMHRSLSTVGSLRVFTAEHMLLFLASSLWPFSGTASQDLACVVALIS